MARQTLLFLHPSAELYGADRTLLDLVQGLDATRWRALVALPRRGVLADALEAAGATVVTGPLCMGGRASLSPRGLWQLARELPRCLRFLRALIAKHEVALVHTNTMVVLGGALAARSLGVPHVWHVHEILTRPRSLARAWAWMFERFSTTVVCNSRATRDSFVRWRPSLGARTTVIPNGVDPARLQPVLPRSEAKALLGIPDTAPTIALVGRINSWKGQGLLLEAAARLRQRLPQLRVILAGDAPPGQAHFELALDQRIERLDLAEVVVRLPFVDEPARVYAAADVVAVPSLRPEPFGLIVTEAMVLSRAVVAANHGGPTDIIEHERTGLLFEPESADALAEALGRVLSNPALAAELGEAGAARARSTYHPAQYIDGFEQIYHHATSGRPLPEVHEELGPQIVHLILGKANANRLNGVNRVVHHLAEAQAAAGTRVAVFGLTQDPDAPTPPRSYRLRLFPRQRRLRLRLACGLRAELEGLDPNAVVHLHGGFLPEMHAAARLLQRLGRRYVFTPHGAYDPVALQRNALAKSLYLRLFDIPLMRHAQTIQAFTVAGQAAIRAQCWRTPIVVLPNGQATRDLVPQRAATTPCFGYVGRLDARTKGLDLLLDAFAEYRRAGGDGELVLVGEGPDRASLQRRALTAGLGSSVRFAGARFGDQLQEAFLGFTVYVQCSRNEGLPGAPLEAASHGLPLLVSEATHLGPEVRRFGAGIVLEELTVAALSEALTAAGSLDRVALQELGQGARTMVEQYFDWNRIARRANRDLYRHAA